MFFGCKNVKFAKPIFKTKLIFFSFKSIGADQCHLFEHVEILSNYLPLRYVNVILRIDSFFLKAGSLGSRFLLGNYWLRIYFALGKALLRGRIFWVDWRQRNVYLTCHTKNAFILSSLFFFAFFYFTWALFGLMPQLSAWVACSAWVYLVLFHFSQARAENRRIVRADGDEIGLVFHNHGRRRIKGRNIKFKLIVLFCLFNLFIFFTRRSILHSFYCEKFISLAYRDCNINTLLSF